MRLGKTSGKNIEKIEENPIEREIRKKFVKT